MMLLYSVIDLKVSTEIFSFYKLFFGNLHYVKSVRIQSYSSPHFPAFGLNTERYEVFEVSLRIRSNAGKCRGE